MKLAFVTTDRLQHLEKKICTEDAEFPTTSIDIVNRETAISRDIS
jgi:hypothetical protein